MAWVKIGTVDMVKEGKGRLFVVDDQEIAVFNVKGKFYAIENRCPHAGVGLAGGEVEDCTVTCPGHGWQFDLETGKHVLMPVGVKTFNVKAEAGSIFLEIQ